MKRIKPTRKTAAEKEYDLLLKQEKRLERSALKAHPSALKLQLAEKVPNKVYTGLESAFCKGFTAVFDHGTKLIEKAYKRDNLIADHAIHDYAVQLKGGRRELRQIHKSASKSDLINMGITGLEGIGLGALGIGMPDIVIFLSMLLKGVYETALNYGFDYISRRDKMLILKMMETSLSIGEDWQRLNSEVDALFSEQIADISDEEFELQLSSCSSAFATDMLLLKFVQGLPVVGIIGGAANPVYYSKVIKYVGLKYRKHYLIKQLKTSLPK